MATHFQGLKSLKKLDLSDNQFNKIFANTFQELSNLNELSLAGNQLNSTSVVSFVGLENLLNLDLKSAFYDPKSRSMRENPLPKGSENFNSFKGDNIYMNTGDATKLYE